MASVLTAGLTNHCQECLTCLESIAPTCPECGAEKPDKGWASLYDSPYPFLGRMIDGRYLIDRFLDSGASGHVYRARGLRFKRFFALKIVDAGRQRDPGRRAELIERFRREVETMSRIRNPHVVAVYEVLELADAVYGLVLDFIDGQTLDSLIESRGLPTIKDAVSIIQQVSNGLHEAHRSGIIHRDLKPQNIMVEDLPATGLFARVLDFGIAQVAGSDGERTARFLGTPLYASPEQCLGGRTLDARSDIYSLGCLFFHLLGGQPPFSYANALRIMDAHIEEPRPRLSDLDLAGRQIPIALENLVSHMMARRPEDRPSNLHLVHQDLTAFLRNQPLRNFGNTPGYRALEFHSEPGQTSEADPPPLDEFVSLAERTSNELSADPTFSEFIEAPKAPFQVDSEINLELVVQRSVEFLEGAVPTLTAVCLDPRGVACVFATPRPEVHLLSLDVRGFHESIMSNVVISAVEIDLMQGMVLLADVRGTLSARDIGTGLARQSWELPGSPLALVATPGGPVYFGTEKGAIYRLERRTGNLGEVHRMPQPVSALHVGEGRELFCGLWDGSVARIGASGARWHLPLAPDAIAAVGLIDEDTYFGSDAKGTLYLGDATTGELRSRYQIGQGLRALRRLDDGRLVGMSLFSGQLQVWSIDVS